MRIMWALFIVCSAILMPYNASAITAATFFTPGECDSSVSINRPVECDTVQVPLDHDNPTGGTISLPIMVVRSAIANSNAPLYLLQGGPGGDTIDTFSYLIEKIDTLLPDDRDIIFYEQRGTTNATPALDCPEVHKLGITLLPEDISYAEGSKRYITAYEQCINRLRQDGIDLSLFNSRQNAFDLIYIAEQLGHDQIDLYGVSYGSLLAQHITRLKPDLIRSLVIDGVVPPNESVDARVYQSRHDALEAIFRDCENAPDCAKAYPTLRQNYTDVMADYAKNPRMWELTDPMDRTVTRTAFVDNHALQGWLFGWMYNDQLVRYIPFMLTELANGRTDQVRYFASFSVFDDSMAEMMYMSTTCSEEAPVAIADYVIPADNLIPLIDDELENDVVYRQTLCDMSQVTPLDASFSAEFRTNVPTLIVSGRYDPITPAVFGDIVAKSVPQATHIVIPSGAHGAMLSNACAADIAKAFWANPSATLDTSCVATQRTQFATPDAFIVTDFVANTAQLNDNAIIDWILIGSAFVIFIVGLFVRIGRGLVRIMMRTPAPLKVIQQQRFMQTGIIISGLLFIGYLVWQLAWIVLSYDYALFFGIPDPFMIVRISAWIFMGLTLINIISAFRAFRQPHMPWYSIVFACMIMLSGIAVSVAMLRGGIY